MPVWASDKRVWGRTTPHLAFQCDRRDWGQFFLPFTLDQIAMNYSTIIPFRSGECQHLYYLYSLLYIYVCLVHHIKPFLCHHKSHNSLEIHFLVRWMYRHCWFILHPVQWGPLLVCVCVMRMWIVVRIGIFIECVKNWPLLLPRINQFGFCQWKLIFVSFSCNRKIRLSVYRHQIWDIRVWRDLEIIRWKSMMDMYIYSTALNQEILYPQWHIILIFFSPRAISDKTKTQTHTHFIVFVHTTYNNVE